MTWGVSIFTHNIMLPQHNALLLTSPLEADKRKAEAVMYSAETHMLA